MLGWGRERLAAKSETSADIIRTFELTGRVQRSYILSRPTDKIGAIRAALKAAGIEFTNDDRRGCDCALHVRTARDPQDCLLRADGSRRGYAVEGGEDVVAP